MLQMHCYIAIVCIIFQLVLRLKIIAFTEVVLRILNAQFSTRIVETFVPESSDVAKNATWMTVQHNCTTAVIKKRLHWITLLVLRLLKFECIE